MYYFLAENVVNYCINSLQFVYNSNFMSFCFVYISYGQISSLEYQSKFSLSTHKTSYSVPYLHLRMH